MDFDDSGIDSDAKNHLDVHNKPKANEPIITFSPDRCRFEGGKSSRNNNSSIVSDFELNSAVVDCPVDQYGLEDGTATTSSSSLTDLLTSSTLGGSPPSNLHHNNLNNGQTNGNSSSSGELQKRLAKQIAQASTLIQPSSQDGGGGGNSGSIMVKSTTPSVTEETEFGEWKGIKNEEERGCSKVDIHSNKYNNNTSGRPTIEQKQDVQMDAEVEVITKSTSRLSFEGRKFGALIPPERLAIPHKPNGNSHRKHSAKSSKGAKNGNGNVQKGEGDGDKVSQGVNSTTGPTSEVKPLVDWCSDESEDELSFFPNRKSCANLTDNMSIDNMSLSGEEDDLHLAPPRPLTRNCPCDPRPWISTHLSKLPSPSGATEQCRIA